eukprot:gene10385-13332_t
MKPINSKVFQWNKSVYDQQVLMESDNCIVVNNLDEVQGYDTKLACHRVAGNRCEIDDEKNIRKGKVPGTIRAARRKLDHELGLQLDTVQDSDFKFLTRVQYASVDKASEHV